MRAGRQPGTQFDGLRRGNRARSRRQRRHLASFEVTHRRAAPQPRRIRRRDPDRQREPVGAHDPGERNPGLDPLARRYRQLRHHPGRRCAQLDGGRQAGARTQAGDFPVTEPQKPQARSQCRQLRPGLHCLRFGLARAHLGHHALVDQDPLAPRFALGEAGLRPDPQPLRGRGRDLGGMQACDSLPGGDALARLHVDGGDQACGRRRDPLDVRGQRHHRGRPASGAGIRSLRADPLDSKSGGLGVRDSDDRRSFAGRLGGVRHSREGKEDRGEQGRGRTNSVHEVPIGWQAARCAGPERGLGAQRKRRWSGGAAAA